MRFLLPKVIGEPPTVVTILVYLLTVLLFFVSSCHPSLSSRCLAGFMRAYRFKN